MLSPVSCFLSLLSGRSAELSPSEASTGRGWEKNESPEWEYQNARMTESGARSTWLPTFALQYAVSCLLFPVSSLWSQRRVEPVRSGHGTGLGEERVARMGISECTNDRIGCAFYVVADLLTPVSCLLSLFRLYRASMGRGWEKNESQNGNIRMHK